MSTSKLIIGSIAFIFSVQINAQCTHPDYEGLMEIYEDLNGINWFVNTGWKEGAEGLDCDPCNWYGIFCTENRVSTLDLSQINVIGTLPDINLSELQNLLIRLANFDNAIPDFSHMGSLIYLDVSFSNFQGSIPNFSSLPLLEQLYFERCNLFGNVPDIDKLPKLKGLNLSFNNLEGPIPDFQNLPNLEALNLHNNKLEGEIPNFSNLPKLLNLHLNNNQLSGSIPDFQNFPELFQIILDDNLLEGEIPNFTGLPELLNLFLDRNNLSGPIPDFENIPKLKLAHFCCNHLSGEIPDFSNLPNLTNLRLFENELIGNIPDFQNLPLLSNLFLSKNQLEGGIPNFQNLGFLRSLFLDDNNLSGNIPDFQNFSFLNDLYLNNNRLTGSIPDFTGMSNLSSLFLQENCLSGNIPKFTNLPYLNVCFLNDNKLEGTIPDFENKNGSLTVMFLDRNNLEGCIPPGACGYLLSASGNDDLPWGGLTGTFCDGDSLLNQIGAPCGSFDDFFPGIIQDDCSCKIDTCSDIHPDMDALMNLYSSTNGNDWTDNFGWNAASRGLACDPCKVVENYRGWTGVICNEDGRVIGLDLDIIQDSMIVGIDGLELTGTLPELDLPFLEKLILTGNNLSGTLPSFDKNPALTHLGLSFNDFSGPLPTFENNPNLIEFRASYNQFTGPLPLVSNLAQLETYTASNNLLEGCFHDAVCDINLFSVLDNFAMPWLGAHENYCFGEIELNTPCTTSTGAAGWIDENCDCQIVSSMIDMHENPISIYPNPAKEEINIVNSSNFMVYSIYNLEGRLIESNTLTHSKINTSNLCSGIFILSLQDIKGHQVSNRFVKL